MLHNRQLDPLTHIAGKSEEKYEAFQSTKKQKVGHFVPGLYVIELLLIPSQIGYGDLWDFFK